MPEESNNAIVCSNGLSLGRVIQDVYFELFTKPREGSDGDEKIVVQVSLTDVFKVMGYTESDRIVVTWVMYRLGLLRKLTKEGGLMYRYELPTVDPVSVLSEEAVANAVKAYRQYQHGSKKSRAAAKSVREAMTGAQALSVAANAVVSAEVAVAPALVEQVASLIVALEERDADLAVANKRIADLEELVIVLKASPKVTVEMQLAEAIAKFRKQ
jgi:hypothetical protein